MHRILSIDVGEKRVGLAMTDEMAIIASPYGFVERKDSVEKIKQIIMEEHVHQIVVGLPYLPSGGLGSQAADVQQFVSDLSKVTSLPIEFENEILSSVEATNRFKQAKKRIKDKGEIDAMAATIILESYLTRNKVE